MTCSILARDEETGQLGAAVQSYLFDAGTHVLFAEPGAGVVAAQMMIERSYGSLGLAAMRDGRPASEALAVARGADPGAPTRQVAMLDAAGRIDAFTGERCVAHCSQLTATGVVAQAAMCRSPDAARAMIAGYTTARGTLAERLVAALAAGERAGGDVRGQKSAAVIVVSGTAPTDQLRDSLLDLRVEDSKRPLDELRRLVRLHDFHRRASAALDLALHGQPTESLAMFDQLERDDADDPDIAFRHALVLAAIGDPSRARARLERCYLMHDGWRELVTRLPAAGLLPDDPRLIAALTAR